MSGYLDQSEGADLSPETDWTGGILPGTTSAADPAASGVAGSFGTLAGTGAGRYGLQGPMTGDDMSGGIGGGIEGVWNWINAPFIGGASPEDVAILVGVVMVSIVLWSLILYHIRIAAETI